MISATIACLERLAGSNQPEIVDWACPVPYFGDPGRATVATVGINPSNKEFVDDDHAPLAGLDQRFPTRHTLGLTRWADVGPTEVRLITDACRRYFDGNSYDRWFGVLDELLSARGSTFYGVAADACHLDLVPFATAQKWGEISQSSRRAIANVGEGLFGKLLADSSVEAVILNGRSVVETFEQVGGVVLHRTTRRDWSLPRSTSDAVLGIAYTASIDVFAGYDLGRTLKVLGFNHNLQSSFGVTTKVKMAIANWIAEELPK